MSENNPQYTSWMLLPRWPSWIDLSLPIKRHKENDYVNCKMFLDEMLRWQRCIEDDDPIHISDIKYIQRFLECLFYMNPCEWNKDVPFGFRFKLACGELIANYWDNRAHHFSAYAKFTDENKKCFTQLMDLARLLVSQSSPPGGGMDDRQIQKSKPRGRDIEM